MLAVHGPTSHAKGGDVELAARRLDGDQSA
jgi:hypothetical protein